LIYTYIYAPLFTIIYIKVLDILKDLTYTVSRSDKQNYLIAHRVGVMVGVATVTIHIVIGRHTVIRDTTTPQLNNRLEIVRQ
jgi:succinate dehydrogenase hydrophobic anchor subunit